MMLRNGIFAAMSINKDATVTSNCSHHECRELVSPEEAQKGKNACNLSIHQTAVTLSGVRHEELLGCEKQDTGPRLLRCI